MDWSSSSSSVWSWLLPPPMWVSDGCILTDTRAAHITEVRDLGRARGTRVRGRWPAPVTDSRDADAFARSAGQAVVSGVGGRRGAVGGACLLEDMSDVALDRVGAQDERRRDLGVGLPRRDQAQHLDLALGEVIGVRRRRPPYPPARGG